MSTHRSSSKPAASGVYGFIGAIKECAEQYPADRQGTTRFIRHISEDFAYIRLQDVAHPLRFLQQMSGVPPIRFGTEGFKESIVDDADPARHYTAFVFVGFWLPSLLAIVVLWLWEILGFIRYKGKWSPGDIRSGYLGIRHGRLVRQEGPATLAKLVAKELTE